MKVSIYEVWRYACILAWRVMLQTNVRMRGMIEQGRAWMYMKLPLTLLKYGHSLANHDIKWGRAWLPGHSTSAHTTSAHTITVNRNSVTDNPGNRYNVLTLYRCRWRWPCRCRCNWYKTYVGWYAWSRHWLVDMADMTCRHSIEPLWVVRII